jgi:hypothetical protein
MCWELCLDALEGETTKLNISSTETIYCSN